MTNRSIPEQDLARIAPMGRDEKRAALQRLKKGWPPYSYSHVRNAFGSILNLKVGLFPDAEKIPLDAILAGIKDSCRKERNFEDAYKANAEVAKCLRSFADREEIIGRPHDFIPISIGTSRKLCYWSPMVLQLRSQTCVPLLDVRKVEKLTVDAKRFAFSTMHQRIREGNPDFADVNLAIITLSAGRNKKRVANFEFADQYDLFSYAQLDQMVRETYEIWNDIWSERAAQAKEEASSDSNLGPLFANIA
ncbi:type VI toxin-antitoxin system SocB family DNA replication inhibitor toxin [Parvularcula maris]|uniref:Uncharacterized protein n=1 Tax=Parvularcula maris TaxID=2965077 RepID=A0A9X2L9B4_9PROT|nr:hypothetical protein [Parvularcula maris]MCQ8184582.1 hypothetical protein [Parvularcula maris]